MKLSDVFAGVAHKELVSVDLPGTCSKQHEFDGVTPLRELFGTNAKLHGKISWHFFVDDQDPEHEESTFTFYNSRLRQTHRAPEWRLYYRGNFLSRASVGDLLIVARSVHGTYYGMIFKRNSAWERAARELFGLDSPAEKFDSISHMKLGTKGFEFLQQQIVAELDLDLALPVAPNDEELVLKKFGRAFPTTRKMSEFARSQVEPDINRPDETLERWLEREEQLFRALENVIIRERLKVNFSSVDEFIEYSLSVQNRRKSRMGFALQNHLAEIFSLSKLRFTAQARTEANNKPDFIFPGVREYHDENFDSALLLMLGVKSTSKDRWRQVLTEADRIRNKHLCTLEAGISVKQTDEMQRQKLTLVLPERLHVTYTGQQQKLILSVAEFIEIVARKQNRK